jgi:hypothetical protein
LWGELPRAFCGEDQLEDVGRVDFVQLCGGRVRLETWIAKVRSERTALVQLHPRELVLPASLSSGFRAMASAGGAGYDYSFSSSPV